MTDSNVRVRFCPSPTGIPHVGLIRTALFNWAYARHTGGTFVFRIEDTDAQRDSADSYAALLDALRWLGLDWDEGPEVGGPYEPYRQSQRSALYREVLDKLIAAGEAYEAYSTAEEVETRHLNLAGTLYGGLIATLADAATGLALRTTLDAGTTSLTSSLSVTFLRPGHPGKVTAMGRVVKRGTRFGYAEADVEDGEGRLRARAAATFTIMPESAA